MGAKKGGNQEPQKTELVKPREVFIEELNNRVILGEQIKDTPINSESDLDSIKSKYSNWDAINQELVKRAFNIHENEYAYKYARLNTFVGLEDVARRRPGRNTLEYQLSDFQTRVTNKIEFLKTLKDMVSVIDVSDDLKPYIKNERRYSNVGFIVHGHDEARKYEVARFIENDLHKKAIILHEMPNKGRTIIEKFEDYAHVDFAVAIWTADDTGKSIKQDAYAARARQNVVFETGFFIGKIGRENVIVLLENGVELPSDYSGVIYIQLNGNWKDDLRKEIAEIYRL